MNIKKKETKIKTLTESPATIQEQQIELLRTAVKQNEDRKKQDEYNVKMAEAKTNHLLHIVLTVFTLGIWSSVWMGVTGINIMKRQSIEKRFNQTSSIATNNNVTPMQAITVISIAVWLVYLSLS